MSLAGQNVSCHSARRVSPCSRLISCSVWTSGPTHVTADRIRCLEHHLLINEFRIQLAQVNRIAPGLAVRFLSSMSPQTVPSLHRPSSNTRENPATDRFRSMDRVHSRRRLRDQRTLRTTKPCCSSWKRIWAPRPWPVHGPLSRTCDRRSSTTKPTSWASDTSTTNRLWNCRFRGFRLLFITHNRGRLCTLCRLIREMQPAEFIWLTDQADLLSKGVWAPIWTLGGLVNVPTQVHYGQPDSQSLPSSSRFGLIQRFASPHCRRVGQAPWKPVYSSTQRLEKGRFSQKVAENPSLPLAVQGSCWLSLARRSGVKAVRVGPS